MGINTKKDYPWKGLVTAYPADGTPTQDAVDYTFKLYSDTLSYLDSIDNEIKAFEHASYEEKKKRINDLLESVTGISNKLPTINTEEIQNVLKSIQNKMSILEPLTKPLTDPLSDLGGVISYLEKIAEYFMGPYTSLAKCIVFYGLYSETIAEKSNEVIQKIVEIQNDLQKALTSLEKFEKFAGMDISEQALKEMEEDKNLSGTYVTYFKPYFENKNK